jgi:transcriptional regulator with XRE-family HTH domain
MSESFGQRLIKWREDKRINQGELARLLNLSPTYISNLERDVYPNSKDGTGKPSEKVVAKIAKALNQPLDRVRLAAGYAPTSQEPKDEFRESYYYTLYEKSKNAPVETQEFVNRLLKMVDRELDREPNTRISGSPTIEITRTTRIASLDTTANKEPEGSRKKRA